MADATRLGALAAQALADRSPIDWRALRARARARADRLFVASLQDIADLRADAGAQRRETTWPPIAATLVTLLAAAAAMQTVVCLAMAAAALTSDAPPDVSTPQVALACTFGFAALLLTPTARRDRRALFLLTAFITTAGAFARTALLDRPWVDAWPWMRLVEGWDFDAFTPACLMLFASDFPRTPRFTRFDVAARRAGRIAWLVGGILFAANLALDSGLSASVLGPLAREHPTRLFWRLFTTSLTFPVLAMVVRTRRAPVDERRRVAGVAFAIALGAAPFLLAGLVRTAGPGADRMLRTMVERQTLDAVVITGLMAMPLLAACAVILHRPFDVSGLRSLAARAARRVRLSARATLSDPRRDVPGALARLRAARGVRELERTLAHELRRGIGATQTHLVRLPPGGALAAMLEAGAGLLDLARDGSLWPLLPRVDRAWATHANVSLVAPIVQRDGTLAAIAAIAGRRDGAGFERADLWFAAAVAAAVSGMWEATDASAGTARDASAPESIEAGFECPTCGRVSATRVLRCACGADPVLAALPVLVADKFLVRRRLGKGGMGVVYLARDIALDRDVVLKTLPGPGPGRVERLRREARAMAALRHEALAAIYGLEVWRETPVLVVEYFPCGALADRLEAGALPCPDALRLARELASALAHMHAHGVLHRDIKPANIALTESGAPRLLDFGLAAPTSTRVASAGTPGYASPEMRRGDEPSPADDLWALSVVTLEALTGARSGTPAGLPPALQSFFGRALAIEPSARYQTAPAWLQALDDILRSLS